MDNSYVFKFVNSNDVRKHLQAINYQFSGPEYTFIRFSYRIQFCLFPLFQAPNFNSMVHVFPTRKYSYETELPCPSLNKRRSFRHVNTKVNELRSV